MPYVNTNAEYQPPQLIEREHLEQIHRPRVFSLAARLSTQISGNPGVRIEFMNDMQNRTHLGGLPVNVGKTAHRLREFSMERATMSLYRDSVFCPALRGGTPSQKRFFDAICKELAEFIHSLALSDVENLYE